MAPGAKRQAIIGAPRSDTLVHRVKETSATLSSAFDETVGQEKTEFSRGLEAVLVPGVQGLVRESASLSYPHIPVGLNHSFSLWVRRPRSNIIDSRNEGDAPLPPLQIGSIVIRGPEWPAGQDEDGFPGALGSVTNKDGDNFKGCLAKRQNWFVSVRRFGYAS